MALTAEHVPPGMFFDPPCPTLSHPNCSKHKDKSVGGSVGHSQYTLMRSSRQLFSRTTENRCPTDPSSREPLFVHTNQRSWWDAHGTPWDIFGVWWDRRPNHITSPRTIKRRAQ